MTTNVFRKEEVFKKVDLQVWRQIFRVIWQSKKELFLLIFFGVLLGIVEALIVPMNEFALTNFIEAHNFTYLPHFIVISVLQIFLFSFSVFGFINYGGRLEANVSYVLRKEAFENLQKLPFSYYDQTKQGWIMARMTSDTRRLARIISWGVLDITWSIFFMFFTVTILFNYEWRLTLIVIALLPILIIIAFLFRKRVLLLNRKARFHNSELTALFNESFLGATTTKSLAIERELSDEFHAGAVTMKKASVRAMFTSVLFSSTLLTTSYGVVALMIALGGAFLFGGKISDPWVLYVFIRATMNFFEPVLNLTRFMNDLQVAQASAERVIDLIYTKPDLDDTDAVKDVYGDLFDYHLENWEELKGDVTFKNVSFYYKKDEPVLEIFNLTVKEGQSVALVGHTGSGKTTIVNLFARFYEPQSGQILIDGKDYRERSLSWLHTKLGYVLQMPELFSTSIKENIRYGNLNASDEEVIAASKAVGLHDFVMTLEEGYDAFVGEGGSFLSVGQKQLISFARAIVADPRILILDEATSSIDSEAEYYIQQATAKLLEGRTSFIVAHRLSTIVNSDIIVLLDQGKVVEQGTHDELLALRGHYFSLYKSQFIQELSETRIRELNNQ